MSEHILLRHRDIPDLNQLEVYRKHGGFEAFRKAVRSMKPGEVTDVVKASGLRGRGGAGFPTGMKWSFIDPNSWPHYVVANADESEPGTFKDREIMERNPFQFLEGVAIAAYAVQANAAYVYLRGEFWEIAETLDRQIAELEAAGLLGDRLFKSDYSLKVYTHLGAGAYICGEETAMLESLEGKLGQPRLRPPFPPSFGLYGKPTVVNNVETLTNVPLILEQGADWYRTFGTERSPGTKVFSLSGRINRPGNYELPLGTTFRELIFDHGGGIPGGYDVKAIMAAGAIWLFPAWPSLFKALVAYGFAARIPVAIVMFFAISGKWGTHYDAPPPGFPSEMAFWPTYLHIALLPQLVFWVMFTVLIGALFGAIVAAIAGRGRKVATDES